MQALLLTLVSEVLGVQHSSLCRQWNQGFGLTTGGLHVCVQRRQ
jgi:hypothetical protein